MMPKRRYSTNPSGHHQTPYNSYVTKEEFSKLESLRKRVASQKGMDSDRYSRGQFLMWMYTVCFKKLSDGIPLEDFCDGQISDLENLIEDIQRLIGKANDFKETALGQKEIGESEDDGQQ